LKEHAPDQHNQCKPFKNLGIHYDINGINTKEHSPGLHKPFKNLGTHYKQSILRETITLLTVTKYDNNFDSTNTKEWFQPIRNYKLTYYNSVREKIV